MNTEPEPEPLGEDMPAQAYAVIDGPSLRELRKHYGVHLRRVARDAKMSHGHLSKVERGEAGREVTPAVLAAYEKAIGVRLSEAGGGPGGWQPGQLSPAALRAFASRVASVAFGGAMHNLDRVLDASGRLRLAEPLREEHVAQLQQIADHLAQLDGPIPGMAARTLLRWLIWFLEDPADDYEQPTSLYAVVATLARRAGHAGEQLGVHEVVRTLYLVGLHAAAVADHPELRALILADIAGQHHRLGHHQAAQAIARLGEADERAPDDARKLLCQVKAAAAEAEAQIQVQLRHALAGDSG